MISNDKLRGSLVRRLMRQTVASGEIRLPAVPGFLDEYQATCERTFSALGVVFNAEQLDHLRGVIQQQLVIAYAASPRSEIVVTYEAPIGTTVNYHVKAQWSTVAAAYDNWVTTREPPYFGTAPDARVWALACEAANPSLCPILDIGAGIGRNALALARRGHQIDAVEMSKKFAATLRAAALQESLAVRVLERDVFATYDDLRRDYRLIVLSEVASDFRSPAELRRIFELAAECLTPGGQLVFNIFLPHIGYEPDVAVKQLGQQVYTSIFTYPEVASAAAGLPLEFVADDSVYEYEQRHLPEEAWPPTGWYAGWVSGVDVFDVSREESPIEMRWLVYKRKSHR